MDSEMKLIRTRTSDQTTSKLVPCWDAEVQRTSVAVDVLADSVSEVIGRG
jgi:hypothetical protein